MFKLGDQEHPTAIAQFKTNGFTFNKLSPTQPGKRFLERPIACGSDTSVLRDR